jgi:acyl carrier protein
MAMREEILKICEEILPQIDFTSTALIDDGILDSLSIMTIVSELSMEYGVTFDMDNLEAKNMNSIDAITETVKSLMK